MIGLEQEEWSQLHLRRGRWQPGSCSSTSFELLAPYDVQRVPRFASVVSFGGNLVSTPCDNGTILQLDLLVIGRIGRLGRYSVRLQFRFQRMPRPQQVLRFQAWWSSFSRYPALSFMGVIGDAKVRRLIGLRLFCRIA